MQITSLRLVRSAELPHPNLAKLYRPAFAMVLDPKVSLQLPFLANVRNQLAIDPSLKVITYCFHPVMIPSAFLEKAPLFAEPSSQANAVDPSRKLPVDFNLIPFGFSFDSLASKGQARIEALVFWQENLKLGFEVRHLDFAHDPDIGFRKEMELTVLRGKGLHFGSRGPSSGGLTIKEIDPLGVDQGGHQKKQGSDSHDRWFSMTGIFLLQSLTYSFSGKGAFPAPSKVCR